ncbi:MAG: preprotein translocase subunit SecE [Acidimicrobiales bacterium]
MNRQTKRILQRQGQLGADGQPSAPKAPPRPAPKPAAQRTSASQFLREVRGEMRKVAWPTRAQVVNYSAVVMLTLVLLVGLIFGLDYVFSRAMLFLFK